MFNEDVDVRARETLSSRSRAFLIATRRHLFPPVVLIATPVDAEPTCRRVKIAKVSYRLTLINQSGLFPTLRHDNMRGPSICNFPQRLF